MGTQYHLPRKTCTVADSPQMVSRVAVIAGALHPGSVRSVRSWICARLFAGAAVVCVILDVSASNFSGVIRARRALFGLDSARGRTLLWTLFQGISPRGPPASF